jgi:predicted RNA binding protein YcfA (HicA-like mRNA interferase family)
MIDQGFELRSVSGSHHNYRLRVGEHEFSYTIPAHGKSINAVYVRRVLELIDEAISAQEKLEAASKEQDETGNGDE